MYQWKVNPLICCWVIKCSDFLLFTHLIRGNAGKAGFGIVYQLLRTWERSYFCVNVTITFMFIYGFVFVFLFIIASTPKKGGTCVLFRLGDQIESLSIGSKSCPRWFSRRTSLSTQMESTFYTMHADKSNVYQLRKSNVYQSRKSNEFVAKKLDAAHLGEILWSLFTFFSSNIGKSIILSAL